MLINEIFNNNAQPLNEGRMLWKEWNKEKYATPFLDTIISSDEQFCTINKDGEQLEAVILPSKENKGTARTFKQWLEDKADTKLFKVLKFTATLLDEDDRPTKETVEIGPQDIIKDDKVTGALKVNLGNIAELVLGCAVTAKYEKQKRDIVYEDVISVAMRLASGNGVVHSKAGKDKISFSATVPSADRKGFAAFVGVDPRGRTPADYGIKPATIKGIETHINSAVKYVNTSPRVLLAVDKAAADPGKNEVDVISDGGNSENQKTTKVDLKIMINPGENGVPQRLNLLSIKAGKVGQFGQVSGYEFERLNDFFQESVGMSISDKTKKKFLALDASAKGKDRTANKEYTRDMNFHNGFTAAYDELEKELRRLAKGDQLDLVERVYAGLKHHATRNEEGVEMVILTPSAKKAFSELTFGPELREALNDYNLVVNRGSSEKAHLLQIYGNPITAKAKNAMGAESTMLVQYRSYQQEGAVRNIVEMGNLLKEIADWETIEQRKAKKAEATPAPAVQNPTELVKAAKATLAKKAPPAAPAPAPEAPLSEPTQTASNPAQQQQQPDELDMWKKNAGMDLRYSGE